jgi:glutamyl-tRNA reductase
MADGRSLMASIAMGASGMNMGTRFIATKEAPVHENVKQAIVAASELDTRLVMRPLRNTERVMNNAAVERLLEKEKALGDDLKFEDIIEQVAGVYPRIMMHGEMDAGAWSCGMVAGLIHDIPTCQELIDRIMAQAEAIIELGVEHFMSWWKAQGQQDSLRLLRRQAESAKTTALDRARERLAAGEAPEAVMERLAHQLTNQLLHGPTSALRQAALEGDSATLAAAMKLFANEANLRSGGGGTL